MASSTRRTNLQRQIDQYERQLEEQAQKIAQEELNRLFRAVQLKVRRVGRMRPGIGAPRLRLHKAEVVDKTSMWQIFLDRMMSRLIEALLSGYITLQGLIAMRVTGEPLELDTDLIAQSLQSQLATRITHTTKTLKREVGRKIVSWYNTPGMTNQDIIKQLQPAFGAARASLISRTEITRLDALVQENTARQLGIDEWWWMTKRDQLVCKRPINGPDGKRYNGCRDLHGKHFKIGDKMPPDGSHPGCRCKAILISKPKSSVNDTPIVDIGHLTKADFEESKHPRDKDGKFTSKEFGESGGNVKFSRNPNITSKKTQDFIESEFNRIPKNERVKSTVKRIIAYDNPEDVYDAAMNLGIEPDVDPEIGVVQGFYDFSTQTIHTSTWDGYDNTSKNLYHEIAHSILGMDEDAVNSWVDAHYTEGKTDTSLESIKTEFFDSLYDKGDLTPGEEELGNVISLEDDFHHAHYVVEDGKLKSGIAWHEDENYVHIDHFGSVESGYGRQTLEHVLQLARDKGKGIAGQSTPEAEGFYRHLGFDLDKDGNFDIPPTNKDAKQDTKTTNAVSNKHKFKSFSLENSRHFSWDNYEKDIYKTLQAIEPINKRFLSDLNLQLLHPESRSGILGEYVIANKTAFVRITDNSDFNLLHEIGHHLYRTDEFQQQFRPAFIKEALNDSLIDWKGEDPWIEVEEMFAAQFAFVGMNYAADKKGPVYDYWKHITTQE